LFRELNRDLNFQVQFTDPTPLLTRLLKIGMENMAQIASLIRSKKRHCSEKQWRFYIYLGRELAAGEAGIIMTALMPSAEGLRLLPDFHACIARETAMTP